MANNEDKLRSRRERGRLRRLTGAAREKEDNLCISYYSVDNVLTKTPSIPTEPEEARSYIVTLLLSILARSAFASCTCAMHRVSILNAVHHNYTCSPLMAIILSLRLFHDRSFAFYVYIITQAYKLATLFT